MRRSRKLALGVAVTALLAGGVAVAGPALAQSDPPAPADPPVECPYECPFDGDQDREQAREQMREHRDEYLGDQDQVRERARDGSCLTETQEDDS